MLLNYHQLNRFALQHTVIKLWYVDSKLNKINFFLLIIFFFLEPIKAQNYSSFSIKQKSYVFQLDKKTGFSAKQNEVDEKKGEFYRTVSIPFIGLEVYNLETGKLNYIINAKNLGFDGFIPTSNDQFWTHHAWGKKYQLIDKKGNIIKELKKEPRANIDLLNSDERFNPLIVYGNSLFNSGLIFFNTALNTQTPAYTNSGIIRKTNFNNTISYIGKITPKALTNYYGFLNSYSMCLVDDKLIIAPHFSEEIQVYDLIKNTANFISIKSKFNETIKPLGEITNHANFSNEDSRKFAANNCEFLGLVYDKYRQVYYRFLRSPNTDRNNVTITIYVLDKSFKILFYYDLPKQYNGLNYFITAKGLNISNKIAYNVNDNLLTYDLFTLIK